MKLLLLAIIIFLTTVNITSQLTLLKEWETTADKIEVDNLGYYYLYNSKKIDKYNSVGEKIATYSDNQLGEIEKIDVANPLRCLVLHKDQNTLTTLDNTLSAKQFNALDLTQANLYNTTAFAYSSLDNGVWFYDKELFQLIKIDLAMNRIYESGNLLRILNLEDLEVTNIFEQKDKLYVVTPIKIIIFDIYGAYYSTIHLQNSTTIGIEENNIYSFYNTNLKAYDTKTFEEQEIKTNLSKNAVVLFKKNKIYSIDHGKFSIYAINK